MQEIYLSRKSFRLIILSLGIFIIISSIYAYFMAVVYRASEYQQPQFILLSYLGFPIGALICLGSYFCFQGLAISESELTIFTFIGNKRVPLRRITWDNIKMIYREDTGFESIVKVHVEGDWEKLTTTPFLKLMYRFLFTFFFSGIIGKSNYPNDYPKIISEICKRARNAKIDDKTLKIVEMERVTEKGRAEIKAGEKKLPKAREPIRPISILIISLFLSFPIAGTTVGVQHYNFNEKKQGRKLILYSVIGGILAFMFLHFTRSLPFWYILAFNLFIGQIFSRAQQRLCLKYRSERK